MQPIQTSFPLASCQQAGESQKTLPGINRSMFGPVNNMASLQMAPFPAMNRDFQGWNGQFRPIQNQSFGLNWGTQAPQASQWILQQQQLEFYRLAQAQALARNAFNSSMLGLGHLPPSLMQSFQAQQNLQSSPLDHANLTQSQGNTGFAVQSREESWLPNKIANTTEIQTKPEHKEEAVAPEPPRAPLGRPKSASFQERQTLMNLMLLKRDSSSPLSDNSTSTIDKAALSEIGSLVQKDGTSPVELIARLDKGFEILKETITAPDMAFIRNYSRMIGYPLKTTQRNTKLGYFSSVCTHESCQVSIIVRKFRLVTENKIEHTH